MFAIFICCLLFSRTLAQIDGQFWWLNSKLDKFREPPPQRKFEYLSDFKTDQSAKIVFRDDDPFPGEEKFAELKADQDKIHEMGKSNQAIKYEDKSEIAWLSFTREAITVTPAPNKEIQGNSDSKLLNSDIFALKFPDDDFMDKINKIKSDTTKENNSINETNNTGKIAFLTSIVTAEGYKNEASESENICTYMMKPDCHQIGGVFYVKHKSDWKYGPFDTRLICCILPIRPQLRSSKIYFLDSSRPCKRCKRSDKETGTALKQRNALLLRKFGSQPHKLRLTTPNPTQISHKIVTPSDEYIDPYWNIKNIKTSKKQDKPFQQTTKYEYDEDYVEDYVVELPKPGLTGLYSDHRPTRPSWSFPTTRPSYGVIDSDEVNGESDFGYSPTVDPRLENRRGPSITHVSGRPVKLTTYADEINYDAESQTISYQSNPDFQVMQGFKLLNLVQNKSRIHRNGKKTTTEKFLSGNSKEQVLTASLESDYDDSVLETDNVYKDCGKSIKSPQQSYENGREIGETEKGSHPSLAMLVLTKRRQSFLCYATIVHPRAVVTAADCVFGRTDPGEITVIAGAWRLDEESREEWQKRMATIHLHSRYRPGELSNNLALLYWKRPLRLNTNVQPACLSDPHVGDNCKFFGWGGYDQAIRKQSRWQKALVLAPRTCEERVPSKRLPSEAFCASVQSRGSVTGIGGPLICSISGRQSVAGIAVWRELAVVLLPAREWITHVLDDLQLY